MTLNVCGIAGGGARTLGSVGAIRAGAKKGKWKPEYFDVVTGTSFGSLVSAMVVNNYSPDKMSKIFIETDFTRFFVPLSVMWKPRYYSSWINNGLSVSLKNVAKFIDKDLKLQGSPRLFINTWDMKENKQIIYCEKKPKWVIDDPIIPTVWEEDAFEKHGLGNCIIRSMVLPGLVADDPRYGDGGYGINPSLLFLPKDSNLLYINTGFPGLVENYPDGMPVSAIDRSLYGYDLKSSLFNDAVMEKFTNKCVIYPKIYNYSSLDLDLSKSDKEKMLNTGEKNSESYWNAYNVPTE